MFSGIQRSRAPQAQQLAGPAGAAGGGAINLQGYSPQKITGYRDGGSIVLDGLANRSFAARVRLDGRIGSETRGQVSVSSKYFLARAYTEATPITRGQGVDLAAALDRYLASAAGRALNEIDRALYDRLLGAVRAQR